MCCVSPVYRLALGLVLQLLLVSPALGSAIGLASVRLRRAIHRALEEGQDDFIAYLTGGQSAGIVLYLLLLLLLLPIIICNSGISPSFSTYVWPPYCLRWLADLPFESTADERLHHALQITAAAMGCQPPHVYPDRNRGEAVIQWREAC